MRGSLFLASIIAGSVLMSGCALNTVNTTTIKKEDKRSDMPPPPPPMMPKKIKKIETTTGVPQHGPNIYKSAAGSACSGANCVTPKYDVTQDKCTDFPVSYRAKREIIQKDIVLVQE